MKEDNRSSQKGWVTASTGARNSKIIADYGCGLHRHQHRSWCSGA
jgi:hypothetical protein